MRPAVDHDTAAAANPFAAIMVELDDILPFPGEFSVENVQHFQKGRIRRNVLHLICHKPTVVVPVLLPPDFQRKIHSIILRMDDRRSIYNFVA
jgi:hypothetical protein